MSLITRCPACRTMFKVVPDQLKISEGWVRCGKCQEIFDAQANLYDAGAVESQVGSADATGVDESVSLDGERRAALATVPITPAPLASEPVIDIAVHEAVGRIEPRMAEVHDTELLSDLPPYDIEETRPLQDSVLPVQDPVPELSQAEPAPSPLPQSKPTPQPSSQSQPSVAAVAPSFMRAPRKPSRWHRPLARAILLVAALLLCLSLLLQGVVQERDRIAAVEPGLRPLVEQVCLPLGCAVRPLRKIESVAIDSSAFTKIKGDLYRLSLTLKNNEPIDLAMPAIELALTDTSDQALIRRVLRPEELNARDGVIRAAAEFQATLLLTVKTNGVGDRVAGYRLQTFYP